jgi:Histidine kinase
MPKDEPMRQAGQQLVADVASQAGLVLANAGLIEDLRSSRQRLVTAQDEARRRLERNLHDGAQQDPVALAIKVRLGVASEDLAQAKEIFGELQADAAGALENLRDLARGIYPPLLADLGLAAALGAQASKSPLPVTVEADGIGRFAKTPRQPSTSAPWRPCRTSPSTLMPARPGSACRHRMGLCSSLCPTTGPATTQAGPRWAWASGTWPTGSPPSAACSRSGSARGQGTTITGHLPVPSRAPAATGS